MINTQKTILIVDDSEINVNTLMDLLDEKYEILAALDGESALEIIEEEEHIDLILLDIMMPGLDGFEVCKRLKLNPNTNDIPIIFITSKTDEDSIENAYDIGGVDYITKPFRAREVISRITSHLALSEQSHILEQMVKEKTLDIQDTLNESFKIISIMLKNGKLDKDTAKFILDSKIYLEFSNKYHKII